MIVLQYISVISCLLISPFLVFWMKKRWGMVPCARTVGVGVCCLFFVSMSFPRIKNVLLNLFGRYLSAVSIMQRITGA